MLCSAISVDQEGSFMPNASAARRGREATIATAQDSVVDERGQGGSRRRLTAAALFTPVAERRNSERERRLALLSPPRSYVAAKAPSYAIIDGEGSPELPLRRQNQRLPSILAGEDTRTTMPCRALLCQPTELTLPSNAVATRSLPEDKARSLLPCRGKGMGEDGSSPELPLLLVALRNGEREATTELLGCWKSSIVVVHS
nr:hypothetical protein Iba_scaffold7178CG0250 [Ipomoea batatas]